MNVQELRGPLLSYWVAKAEDRPVVLECWLTRPKRPSAVWMLGPDDRAQFHLGPYHPHRDPRLLIELIKKYRPVFFPDGSGWYCYIAYNLKKCGYGDDLHEAVCRAVVAHKFGDVVPDEVGA